MSRKSTNLSVDVQVINQARDLDINISRAAEEGIARAVADEKARLWKADNRDAIAAWNQYANKHGLPLDDYRQF